MRFIGLLLWLSIAGIIRERLHVVTAGTKKEAMGGELSANYLDSGIGHSDHSRVSASRKIPIPRGGSVDADYGAARLVGRLCRIEWRSPKVVP
jgi:hypothetical protein